MERGGGPRFDDFKNASRNSGIVARNQRAPGI